MNIRFVCPQCNSWTKTDRVDGPSWPCAGCGQVLTAAASETTATPLDTCRCCGNPELYIQKDFPHWLGMAILVIACGLSIFTYANRWITATWALLIGSAILDGVLYLLMGNVTICYRCLAQHRGFPIQPQHHSFDLAVGEKYRQERLRRQQLGKA